MWQINKQIDGDTTWWHMIKLIYIVVSREPPVAYCGQSIARRWQSTVIKLKSHQPFILSFFCGAGGDDSRYVTICECVGLIRSVDILFNYNSITTLFVRSISASFLSMIGEQYRCSHSHFRLCSHFFSNFSSFQFHFHSFHWITPFTWPAIYGRKKIYIIHWIMFR